MLYEVITPGFVMNAPLTTPDCWMIHELLYNMKKADVDVAVMEVSVITSYSIHYTKLYEY